MTEALAAEKRFRRLLAFWDEAVPGNPLVRRAYIALADFAVAPVLDTAWLTLALARTQDWQAIPDGFCKCMCQVLRSLFQEARHSFTTTLNGAPTLLFLCGIIFLRRAQMGSVCARAGKARPASCGVACNAQTSCPACKKREQPRPH